MTSEKVRMLCPFCGMAEPEQKRKVTECAHCGARFEVTIWRGPWKLKLLDQLEKKGRE